MRALVLTLVAVAAVVTGVRAADGAAPAVQLAPAVGGRWEQLATSGAAAPSDPYGTVTGVATPDGSLVSLTGWAADPSAPGSAIDVDLVVDGRVVGSTTTGATWPVGAGMFTATGPAPTGAARACAVARNAGDGLDAELGCRAIPARPAPTTTTATTGPPAPTTTTATTAPPATTTTGPPTTTTTTAPPPPNTPGAPFPRTCSAPSTHLTDPAATTEARCVYAAVEAFGQGRGDLPIGQQLNTARLTQRQPVSTLQAETYATGPAATPAVIGTDLDAIVTYLNQGDAASLRIVADHIDALVADGRAGRLVTASWHARSPFTGGSARDDTGVDLASLLDPSTPAARAWARQTDQIIGIIRRFADAGVPVAFRPLHEANLSAFWWGQADPAQYRAIWEQLRQRFEAAGIHNVIWVFAPNHPHSRSVPDPLTYAPARFDVFGIDTYDPEDAGDPADQVRLATSIYDRIVALGRPFALTEVGPLGSDGTWDPATVTTAVSQRYPRTAWALFWATYSTSSRMAIVDLGGHQAWWARCDDGTCPTTRPR